MKLVVAALWGALLCLTSAQVDTKCVEKFCPKEFSDCTSDQSGCMKAVKCIQQCWMGTDPIKIQSCTNVCYYSYADDTFDKTMTCLVTHKCITLPANPSTCKSSSVKFQKNITVADISGTRWRVKGFNPAYDCYPCQNVTISSTKYDPSFNAVLEDKSTKSITLEGVLTDNSPKPGFNVTITLDGLPVDFTFWPFDSIEDVGNTYYLLYYCGKSAQWNYDGAFVLSSATAVSTTATSAISTSFMNNVGLDYSQFCSPQMSGC